MPMAVFEASAKERSGIKEQSQNISLPRHTQTHATIILRDNIRELNRNKFIYKQYVLNLRVKTLESYVHNEFM